MEVPYLVTRFPSSVETMASIMDNLIPGISFEVVCVHFSNPIDMPQDGINGEERMKILRGSEERISSIATQEKVERSLVAGTYDVLGTYSNGMYFTFTMSRHGSMYDPRPVNPILFFTDITLYPRSGADNAVTDYIKGKIVNIFCGACYQDGSTPFYKTPGLRKLLQDYPSEDYTLPPLVSHHYIRKREMELETRLYETQEANKEWYNWYAFHFLGHPIFPGQ